MSAPKRVKATLMLNVWYDNVTDVEDVKDCLKALVDHAAGEGLLSNTGDAVVDTWDCNVETHLACGCSGSSCIEGS